MKASDSYARNMEQIRVSIQALEKELEKHQQEFAEDNEHWGYVGDTALVLELIKRAVNFLGQNDEEET